MKNATTVKKAPSKKAPVKKAPPKFRYPIFENLVRVSFDPNTGNMSFRVLTRKDLEKFIKSFEALWQ